MPFAYTVRTDKDTHFTGAIAQNAKEDENLTLPGTLRGTNGNARIAIRSIMLQSDQNLSWELIFWSTDGFDNTDLDLDTFLSRWTFAVADGVQIAGANQFYYYIEGLDIPYVDADNTGELHVSLVCRSAAGKTAGAGGEVVVQIAAEPIGAW
jgi:hypothetical protein